MAATKERTSVKASELDPNERASIMFGMPAELKAMIEEAASAKGIAAAAIVREIVADHFSYTLPEIQRGGARRKYANDEEREAARKAKAEKRKNLINTLLKAYKNGELPPEILAALDAGNDDEDEDDDEGDDEDSE